MLVHPGLPPLLYLSHITSLTLHFSHTDFFPVLLILQNLGLAFASAVFCDCMSSFFLFIPLTKHQHHHSKRKPQTSKPKISALLSPSSFTSLLIQQMFVKGCDSEKCSLVRWELCANGEADPKTSDDSVASARIGTGRPQKKHLTHEDTKRIYKDSSENVAAPSLLMSLLMFLGKVPLLGVWGVLCSSPVAQERAHYTGLDKSPSSRHCRAQRAEASSAPHTLRPPGEALLKRRRFMVFFVKSCISGPVGRKLRIVG